MHLVVLAANLIAFAMLLMVQPRHQQEWLRRKLPAGTSRRLRCGGFAALVIAFLVACASWGWVDGVLCWFGWLTVAAIASIAANTNRERILRKVRR